MINHYDEYLERVQWKPAEKIHSWVASRLAREFDKWTDLQGKVILEIGTGTGRLAQALKGRKIAKYVGIEPSTKLAKYAKKQGLDVFIQELPFLSSDFQDKFDGVISLHVIEHAPNYLDARRWIEEMIRVTKPGGYVLVATPDVRDYKNFFWDSDWSHGYPTTPARISQIFNDLKIVVRFSGTMHLGSTSVIASIFAYIIDLTIPTRLIDVITLRLFNRPLASGLKIALIWGLSVVLVQKPQKDENVF